MKKTLTINIVGTVFHIEEDAYEILKSYLAKVNLHFAREEGGHEIINDIESRISELFKQRLNGNAGVITLAMVNSVIEIMGLPDEIIDEDPVEPKSEQTSNSSQQSYHRTGAKKLYRDPSGSILGGVCGGLAHYLKIERIWVRIIFLILTIGTGSFAPGVFVLIYIILWVAVPKALTYSQRLEMQGEPVNVENIGKKAKEEPNTKNAQSGPSDPYKANGNPSANYHQQTDHQSGRSGVLILKIIAGIVVLLFALPILFGLVIAAFTTTHIFGLMSSFVPDFHPDFIFNLFGTNFGSTISISLLLIIGIPILLLVYAGIHLLFNLQSSSRGIVFPAIGVWFIAIILAIGSSFGVIDEFRVKKTVKESVVFEKLGANDTLRIVINKQFMDLYDESDIQIDNYKMLYDDHQQVIAGRPSFNVKKSENDQVQIQIRKTSRGERVKQAADHASFINYKYELGDLLSLNPYFIIEENKKWRNQSVGVTLFIPEEFVIYLDESLLPIIDDIENVTNTWDGHMVDKYWKMSKEGLIQVSN